MAHDEDLMKIILRGATGSRALRCIVHDATLGWSFLEEVAVKQTATHLPIWTRGIRPTPLLEPCPRRSEDP
jgi:hypothetical protein